MIPIIVPVAGEIIHQVIRVFGEGSERADELERLKTHMEAESRMQQAALENEIQMKRDAYEHEVRLREIEQRIADRANEKERLLIEKERIALKKERLRFEWEKWKQQNAGADKDTRERAREAYEYHEKRADERSDQVDLTIEAIDGEVSGLALQASRIVEEASRLFLS